jgi:hypothetical protein
MLDEKLWIYMVLNYKMQELFFLIFPSKLVAAKNPTFS